MNMNRRELMIGLAAAAIPGGGCVTLRPAMPPMPPLLTNGGTWPGVLAFFKEWTEIDREGASARFKDVIAKYETPGYTMLKHEKHLIDLIKTLAPIGCG